VLLSLTDNPEITLYQWKLDGDAVGSNFNTFTALVSGEYSLDLTYEGGCTNSSANTFVVTTEPSPDIPLLNKVGAQNLCEGDTLFLSVTNVGTGTYQWLNESVEMTDQTDSIIILTTGGIYKVGVTESGLCESFSGEIEVNVNAMPAQPIIETENYVAGACKGEDPIVLSVENMEAGITYRWKRNNIDIPGATGETYTDFLDEEDYSVVAMNSSCEMASELLTIDFAIMPDSPEIIAEGPNIWYLACSNDSASEYKWYLDGQLIEGADEYLYVAGTQEGKFEVAISKEGSCFAKSDPIWLPLGTGIEVDPWENLKIYPNPTPGLFTLEMDNHLMGELIIDIFGESGSKIINIKFHKETAHFKTQIDLSEQPPAAYLIGLMLDKYRTNRTLIVE